MYRPTVVKSSTADSDISSAVATSALAGASQGKADGETRRIFGESSVVGNNNKSSGSALLEIGKTKVIASIYGPKAKQSDYSESGELKCDVRFAPFSSNKTRDKSYFIRQNQDERKLSNALRRSLAGALQLENFPKSLIEVVVLVLDDDGGVLPAAVIASTLALADAGIELYDLVVGCSVGVYLGSSKSSAGSTKQSSVSFIVDPDAKQEENADGMVTISYMPSLESITDITIDGALAVDTIGRAVTLCIQGCGKMHGGVRSILLSQS